MKAAAEAHPTRPPRARQEAVRRGRGEVARGAKPEGREAVSAEPHRADVVRSRRPRCVEPASAGSRTATRAAARSRCSESARRRARTPRPRPHGRRGPRGVHGGRLGPRRGRGAAPRGRGPSSTRAPNARPSSRRRARSTWPRAPPRGAPGCPRRTPRGRNPCSLDGAGRREAAAALRTLAATTRGARYPRRHGWRTPSASPTTGRDPRRPRAGPRSFRTARSGPGAWRRRSTTGAGGRRPRRRVRSGSHEPSPGTGPGRSSPSCVPAARRAGRRCPAGIAIRSASARVRLAPGRDASPGQLLGVVEAKSPGRSRFSAVSFSLFGRATAIPSTTSPPSLALPGRRRSSYQIIT